MSRLPAVTPKQVVNVLLQAGFEQLRQTGSHLHLRHPQTRRRTVVPMHNRDVPRGLLLAILKQAGLTADQFRELL